MAYIAPIHRPSSIRHALQIKLLSEDEDSLVIVKTNRIEIWGLDDHHLSLRHSKVVNGTISMIQKLRPKESDTDLLFVGIDTFHYFTLAWNKATSQLDTIQELTDAGEKLMRDSQSLDRCLVDPTGRFMVMHLWEGVLTALRLLTRKNAFTTLDFMEQVRLSELFVDASTFLYSQDGHPRLALLHHPRHDVRDMELAVYRLTSDDRDMKASAFDPERDKEISHIIPDPGAALVIPVPHDEYEKKHNMRNTGSSRGQKPYLGGLIVVGETGLTYIDAVSKAFMKAPLQEASIFVAWAAYDDRHYFLADDYGRMHLLTVHAEGSPLYVTGLEVSKIGRTSRASCMAYLDNNMLFVGSHYGDSQLWRVNFGTEATELLQLVQSFPNIGPILDFAIMDMGNRDGDSQLGNEYSSGQARLVTGSGAHKDGSLRSVRSGVGLQDLGILADFQDVRGLFSLRSHGSQRVDTLVASFLTETRIFRFDMTGEVEEVDAFEGVTVDRATLIVADVDGGRRLQVTSAAATLVDTESGVAIAEWKPPGEAPITAASANLRWVLLSVGGKSLVSLSIEKDLATSEQKDVAENDQVACVHASPRLPNIGVVGFWSSGSISMLDLATLRPYKSETLRSSNDNASVPRDVALVQVLPPGLGGPTLFVAMEDGHVVTFNVSADDLTLSGRKRVILGTQAARFHLLARPDGMTNVFATTEHPSLIYCAEGRIVYSAVTAEDATYVCAFDTEAYPDSIAVATASQVKVSQIDTERRTHVRTLEMGETIRRIAYSPKEQVFGLGCIKRELTHGEEVIKTSFELVDEVAFASVGKPFRLKTPGVTEMIECVIRATLPDSYGKPAERFLVGTSFLAGGAVRAHAAPYAGENDESRGRLLVLGIDQHRSPYLIMQHRFKGECRCLSVMSDNKIVVALTKTILIGSYVEESTTSAKFDRMASYRPSTYPVDIAVEGNMIAVADLMNSLSLVEFIPSHDGLAPHLVEQARYYQAAWSTAVSHIEGESWLEADAQGNLMVLRRNPAGVTYDDQRRMEMTSEMNLGEQVNRIRKVAVETSPNAMIVPRAFVATVEGGIYLFATVAPQSQDLLLRFQSKIADAIKTPGNISFADHRSFRNAEREGEGPFRFLDGELLERFLDVDEETQEYVCHGLGPSVEDMRNMVEELKRMH